MSYCVNCGVELEASQKACPLCGVKVINPAAAEPEATSTPWPKELDAPKRRIKKLLVALIVALILLIPIAICLFSDYNTNGALTWSPLVGVSEALTFVFVFSPLLFKKYRPTLCALIDGVATILFLYVIAQGKNWFFPLALPLAATATALCCGLTLLISRKRRGVGLFAKIGFVLVAAGLFSILVELLISNYTGVTAFPGWSVYVSMPCIVTGSILFVINTLPGIKDQLRRRFFI